MSLKKSHKSYPQEFKDEAVLMVLEQGYCLSDLSLTHCILAFSIQT
ncbi:transposase [Proteus vulgaris]|nr:transposase [Proteus vulgaris]MBG5984940.1 transposase [Proteus vulgaris]